MNEIYQSLTQRLSLTERFQLATMLLNDLAQSGVTVTEPKLRWDEEDQQEMAAIALQYAAAAFFEDEDPQ